MDTVTAYHERSKHHLDRYAPGPGGLDWATQPDPFRRFAGAPLIELPLLEGELPATYGALFQPRPAAPFTRASLAHLLELALGLAAWKSYGTKRWALRCNPSSGNLHPTEGYLITPDLPDLAGGVYHYAPREHGIEQRAACRFEFSEGALLALTGIHWREAWKYGLRAFRYCQHDCGHAVAALSYAAAGLGWPVRLLGHWGDEAIAAVTGVDRAEDFQGAEAEAPEAMLWIGPGEPPPAEAVRSALDSAGWRGQANTLSPGHVDWPDIAQVAAATRKAATPPSDWRPDRDSLLLPIRTEQPASRLIRQRRSAQAFDGQTALPAVAFFRMLDALLPRAGLIPWAALPWSPRVHPVLFVHRVEGLEPGLYCLPRRAEVQVQLKARMRPDWLWAEVPGCPGHIPLKLLAPLDLRGFAATAACHQDIAADSAFSLAMLAEFEAPLAEGPWRYRELFWEAGMLGHALYLEAEAAGAQGTGIGCYFDDAVHEALGLKNRTFQDLYHFTVGGAVTDLRLVSEPAYAHLAGRAYRP